MKDIIDKEMFFYVDESGDTTFYNKKGVDLIKKGSASKVFMVGYLETAIPNQITKAFQNIKNEISKDEYTKSVPSIQKSINYFHAKDDCPEVREKVFKAIKKLDFKAFIIVARKKPDHFRNKFDLKASKLYTYMVEKLFENRLHLYSNIDIYFSKMGNTVREQNMKDALENAKKEFYKKWGQKNQGEIRVFIQEPSQIQPLQLIDYVLWAVNRFYEKGEERYYQFIKEKISLIQDIFDFKMYPKNYYSDKNPLDIKKMSPL